jgi:scyllo-inositol 2-dehydrogenase (NADP+)
MAGQVFHAPLLAPAGLELRVVMTSRADEVAALYPDVEVEAAGDVDAVIGRDDVDLVVAAAPNAAHVPIARRAIAAGKHVVIDKPLALTVAEADEMIAAAEAKGVVLTAFQNRRWDADFLTIRRELDAGRIGEVLAYEARYDRFNPAGLRTGAEPGPGAGLLWNLGPHLVDQALQLFGMPDWLVADLATQVEGGRVDDAFFIRMGRGALRLSLDAATIVADPAPRYAIHGRHGSLRKSGLDPQEEALKAGAQPTDPGFGVEVEAQWLRFHPPGGGSAEALPSETGRYLTFYERLRDTIETGAPPPVSAFEAREVVRVIAAAFASAADGRRIDLTTFAAS